MARRRARRSHPLQLQQNIFAVIAGWFVP